MMTLRYDEDLLEAVVVRCTAAKLKGVPSLQIARFGRERERLYSILDPEERNSAFFKLHLDWFREWGLERLVLEPLREFPLLWESLRALAFRKARDRKDEGAELYVNEAAEP